MDSAVTSRKNLIAISQGEKNMETSSKSNRHKATSSFLKLRLLRISSHADVDTQIQNIHQSHLHVKDRDNMTEFQKKRGVQLNLDAKGKHGTHTGTNLNLTKQLPVNYSNTCHSRIHNIKTYQPLQHMRQELSPYDIIQIFHLSPNFLIILLLK